MLLNLKTRAMTQVAGSDGNCCPRWSPDGRWVIALSADNQKLFFLDMSTQKWRQVADKIGIIGYMTWSRDRKYVGFDTSFTVDPAFSRVSPSDGQVARVGIRSRNICDELGKPCSRTMVGETFEPASR